MSIIDSHSHIDFNDFDTDRNIVIKRALKEGINNIIVSSTIADRWKFVREVCQENQSICYPAYGLHPMFMHSHLQSNTSINKLKQWLQSNKAIAIGEIGLDFYIDNVSDQDKRAQIEIFIAQLEIANELGLPVIIHTRKSLDIVLKYLRKFRDIRGLIHSFSGSEQQAKQLIDLGFYLSFGGPITYSRATRLHKLIKNIPLDAMLVETDSPDQPASIHYKQRNEPAFIVEVIRKIAELKQVDIDSVKRITTLNAMTLFNFKSY